MRASIRFLAVCVAMTAVAACSDSATSPATQASRIALPSAPAFDYSGGGSRQFGDQSTDFRLTAAGGKYNISGLFTIDFPAGSVCKSADAPAGANGQPNWDAPCATLGSGDAINVHAVARLAFGGLIVDFTPHMRFAPGKSVTVSTGIFAPLLKFNRDFFARHPESLRPLAMYYTPSLSGSAVADYVTDASLVTHIDLSTGLIWRRIKHTSGYLVGVGEPCDPGPNLPDCIEVDGFH